MFIGGRELTIDSLYVLYFLLLLFLISSGEPNKFKLDTNSRWIPQCVIYYTVVAPDWGFIAYQKELLRIKNSVQLIYHEHVNVTIRITTESVILYQHVVKLKKVCFRLPNAKHNNKLQK